MATSATLTGLPATWRRLRKAPKVGAWRDAWSAARYSIAHDRSAAGDAAVSAVLAAVAGDRREAGQGGDAAPVDVVYIFRFGYQCRFLLLIY